MKIVRKCTVNWRIVLCIAFLSLVVSVFSHAFMIGQWAEGRFMAGMGDGLSQMLPFKKMLYDMYARGSFFYTDAFGLGGGVYSQLGYYFSTSIVFWVTSFFTCLLETIGLIDHPDLFYWANLILIVSILRQTLIIIAAFGYFRCMKLGWLPAFLGASIYGTSVIYFRHAMYWEFFADAMLWLPLLLIGVERIMRTGKAGLFVVMVAVSMFDNFYFAYVNFLLAGIYIIVRWMVRQEQQETRRLVQVRKLLLGGLIGMGMSAVSFVPSVYGFLNNYRPPYTDPIPLFERPDNLLFAGRVMVVFAFAVLCMWFVSFYKDRLFRLFAVLFIISVVLHYSPLAASVFNGFSAPQYRWEYFLGLVMGGLAAASFEKIKELTWQAFIQALAGAFFVYLAFYRYDEDLQIEEWLKEYTVVAALLTGVVFLLYMLYRRKWTRILLMAALIFTSIYTANEFQSTVLAGENAEKLPSETFMNSEKYCGPEQLALIRKIQKAEDDPRARIDWMIPTRNNTPITEEFKGMSVYSSILNRELLYFYLHDLKIDMGRESVSRYATMGGRANLYSLFQGKYVMIKKGNEQNIPYGFRKFAETAHYAAYQNERMLPFARATDRIYSEESLSGSSVLAREHAMLDGIVLAGKNGNRQTVREAARTDFKIETKQSRYADNVLEVTGKKGGIDLIPQDAKEDTKDFYVMFYLKRMVDTSPAEYPLTVNSYQTKRKANGSIYRTNVNDLAIRVPRDEKISIRLPKGKYKLKNIAVYEENYAALEKARKEAEVKPKADVQWDGGSRMHIDYDNREDASYMSLPLPYEKGWHAKVNGEHRKVEAANYAFSAIKLDKGRNRIELIYRPPYFSLSLAISVIAAVLFIWLFWRSRQQKKEMFL